MFPIFVTIMLIGMIWSGFGYSGGALLFAIMLVIGGWAVLIFWAGGKSPDADPKQTQPSPNSAKSASPASSSRPGAYGGHAAAGTGVSGGKWDTVTKRAACRGIYRHSAILTIRTTAWR